MDLEFGAQLHFRFSRRNQIKRQVTVEAWDEEASDWISSI